MPNDLKFDLRQLLKNPGFTAAAVLTLTLALGLAANIAMAGTSSSRTHGQRCVDFDFGMFTVESQNLRGVQNLDPHQLIGSTVIEKDVLIRFDRSDFAAFFSQVNVSCIDFWIVSYFHKLKIDGLHDLGFSKMRLESLTPNRQSQISNRKSRNDLKFAFRQLLKNPGFTAVACLCLPVRSTQTGGALACAQRASRRRQAVLTLALGIGANMAI